jgi:RHH-type transcriptional regulator, rel operon repressor / antitoxin RelB
MAVSSVLSVRVNEKDEQILSKLAESKGVSKSKLVAEAIHNYVEMNEQYRKLIKERIAAADRGEFATEEEMRETFAQWGVEYTP